MKNQLSPILKLNNKTIKIPTIPSVVLDTDKTNDKHVTQTRPIEPTADLNCVQQLVLADIKNLPSQLTYVDNNPFLSYIVPGDRNWFFSFAKFIKKWKYNKYFLLQKYYLYTHHTQLANLGRQNVSLPY